MDLTIILTSLKSKQHTPQFFQEVQIPFSNIAFAGQNSPQQSPNDMAKEVDQVGDEQATCAGDGGEWGEDKWQGQN